MACIDDVILDEDTSEAALTHVPTGRDALLILAFLKDQGYDIRPSEERTALAEQTIEAKNIVAAFDPDGNIIMSNNWIMKKNLGREEIEMYNSKIQEFADAFFKYVNTDQQNKEKSETYIHPQQPRSDGTPPIRAKMMRRTWNPLGRDPSSRRSPWSIAILRT